MKKVFLFALSAVALISCVKENQPTQEHENLGTETSKGELVTLSFEAGLATKTTLGTMTSENTLPVIWEAKDKLAIFVEQTPYSDIAIEIDEENSKKAYFSTQIKSPEEGDQMVVFYPSEASSVVEGGVKFTLDATQLGAGNGLPKRVKSYQPLAAAIADAGDAQTVVANGGASLDFKNVFAAVRFTFPANDIMKISFRGNDNEDVAGTYVIAADGSIASVSEGKKEVTLVTSDDKPFKAEYDGTALAYQLLVAPQTFEKGFTLTMTTGTGATFTKSTTKQLALSASDIVYLGDIKLGIGISSVERVWGYYNKPSSISSNWPTNIPDFPASTTTNNRNIALDDEYVYMTDTGKGLVYAFNVADGAYSHTLSKLDSEGNTVVSGGSFTVCDVNVIDSNGSSIVLVANFINNNEAQTLKVYAYELSKGAAKVVLSYPIGKAGYRLGDKFSVTGDWSRGEIMFFNAMGNKEVLSFDITDGTISNTPSVIGLGTPTNTYSALYKYSDTEYLLAGSGAKAQVYEKTSTMVNKNGGDNYPNPVLDPDFFDYNGHRYMVYAELLNSYKDGAMNISEIKQPTLLESLEKGNKYDFQMGLGDPSKTNITAGTNGNGVGGCDVRLINGVPYIAACVPGAGLSLFVVR